MRQKDLATSPNDLSYEDLMLRVGAIRESRNVTPAKPEATKKGKRTAKKKDKLADMLSGMSEAEKLQFIKDNLGG